jgi:small subunit ribosomal protein S18
MPSPKLRARREKNTKAGAFAAVRRRSCSFCAENAEDIDYKNFAAFRRIVSERGKIRSRRITGTCRRHQNQIVVAIKRAREMALLPTPTR